MTEVPEAPYKYIYNEVIVDGKTVKVFQLGKFGKELVDKIPVLEALIAKLQSEIHNLRKPERQQKALNLLKAETKPRTYQWVQHRVSISWWEIKELVDTGKLNESKQGTHLMLEVPKP